MDTRKIPSTPRIVEALRRHGTATISELATELNLTTARVTADLGGLHDYGYVTRYGNQPTSTAAWQGIEDDYVTRCLERIAS